MNIDRTDGGAGKGEPPVPNETKAQASMSNLLTQMAAAERWRVEAHNELLAKGFLWDGQDGYYRPDWHPKGGGFVMGHAPGDLGVFPFRHYPSGDAGWRVCQNVGTHWQTLDEAPPYWLLSEAKQAAVAYLNERMANGSAAA